MSGRKMTQREAIVIAGILGAVVLFLIFPVWRPMVFGGEVITGRDVVGEQPENASGGAISGSAVSGTFVSGFPASGSAVSGSALVRSEGQTLAERIAVPEGYVRAEVPETGLAAYIRKYPMKKDGGKVKLYNGQPAENQDSHIVVFKLPLDPVNLQQEASAIQRVYAEYYWSAGQQDRISFLLDDGFKADYVRWREGYRLQNSGTGTSWVESAAYDDSYDTFVEYLKTVFQYSGVKALAEETTKVANPGRIQAGDVFVRQGDKAHAVMVVDVCENAAGEKAFLLAQGGSPAQQFHVLKNPAHEDDPWYYESEITSPLETPECTFKKGIARSMSGISD